MFRPATITQMQRHIYWFISALGALLPQLAGFFGAGLLLLGLLALRAFYVFRTGSPLPYNLFPGGDMTAARRATSWIFRRDCHFSLLFSRIAGAGSFPQGPLGAVLIRSRHLLARDRVSGLTDIILSIAAEGDVAQGRFGACFTNRL